MHDTRSEDACTHFIAHTSALISHTSFRHRGHHVHRSSPEQVLQTTRNKSALGILTGLYLCFDNKIVCVHQHLLETELCRISHRDAQAPPLKCRVFALRSYAVLMGVVLGGSDAYPGMNKQDIWVAVVSKGMGSGTAASWLKIVSVGL